RVLPWRRQPATPVELGRVLDSYRSRHPRAQTALITRAHEVAREAHEGQVRKSGDPYIHHPLAVALILADLGLDDITVAAALLHDAGEDTGVVIERIPAECGREGWAMVA